MNWTLHTTLLDRIECLEQSGRQNIPWNEVAANNEAVARNSTVGFVVSFCFSPSFRLGTQ